MSLIMATRYSQCLPTLAQQVGNNYVKGSGSQVVRIDLTLDDDYSYGSGGSWELTINGITLTAVNADYNYTNVYLFNRYVLQNSSLNQVVDIKWGRFYQHSPLIRSAHLLLISEQPDTSFTYSMSVTQGSVGTVGFVATELEDASTASPAGTSGNWGGNVNDTTGGTFVGQMQPLTAFGEATIPLNQRTGTTTLIHDNGWKTLTGIKVNDSEYNSAEENTFKISITNYPDDAFGGFCWKDGEMYVAFNWICNMTSSQPFPDPSDPTVPVYPLLRVRMFNSAYSNTVPVQTWDLPEDIAYTHSGHFWHWDGIFGSTVWLRVPDSVIETLENNWIHTDLEFIAAPESVGGSWIQTGRSYGDTVQRVADCFPIADDGDGEGAYNKIFYAWDGGTPEDEFWKSLHEVAPSPSGPLVALNSYGITTAHFTVTLDKPCGPVSAGLFGGQTAWHGTPQGTRRQINYDLMEDPRGEDSNSKWLRIAANNWPAFYDTEYYSEESKSRTVKVTLLTGSTTICTVNYLGCNADGGPLNEWDTGPGGEEGVGGPVLESAKKKITVAQWNKLNSAGQANLKIKVEVTGYDDDDAPTWTPSDDEFAVKSVFFRSGDTVFQAISVPIASRNDLVNSTFGDVKFNFKGPVRIESHINNPEVTGTDPHTTTSFSMGPPYTPDEPYTRNWGETGQWLPLSDPSLGPSVIRENDFGYKANIAAWSDAVFLNRQSYNRCYYAAFDTSSIDISEDVLLAGSFIFRMYVTSKDGYIGTFLQPSAERCLKFTFYYQKNGGGAQVIDAFNWHQGDGDDNDGYTDFLCDATGHTRIADLIAGGTITNRNVYCQIQALPHSTTPAGGWVTNDYDGFDTESYLYPNAFIPHDSDEQNVSSDDGWDVYGAPNVGSSIPKVLSSDTDDQYIKILPGKTVVVGFPAPYINYVRDFPEAESVGMSPGLQKNAYSFWSTATDANKKFVEARIASVTADNCKLRIEWWFDPDRDPYYDSRLRNTSQEFDVADCPTWAFGEDGSPDGNAMSSGWHEDDAVGGLTPTQQGQFRVMLRNTSTVGTPSVRVSNLRLNINPLTFAHVNCSKSRLIFEPNFGQ